MRAAMRAPATALPTPIPAAAPGEIKCLRPGVVKFVVEVAMDTGNLDVVKTDKGLSDDVVVELAFVNGDDVVVTDKVLDDEFAAELVLVDEDEELVSGMVCEMIDVVE